MSKDAHRSKTDDLEPKLSSDDTDDVFDLPVIDEDIILTGAAADAAGLEDKLKSLPRILRIALLIDRRGAHIHERLISDIATLCPKLHETAAFAAVGDADTALTLAVALDRLAVADDDPELRHIADCLRLISLPLQQNLATSEDYRRVTRTLLTALDQLPKDIDLQLGADIETFVMGWSMLPALGHRLPRYHRPGHVAANEAGALGELTAARRIEAAEEAIWTAIDARAVRQAEERNNSDKIAGEPIPRRSESEQHQRIVATLSQTEMKNTRLKDLLPPIAHVINKAIPLIEPPLLAEARKALLFEFPHAQAVVDTILGDLVGRSTVLIRPTLILGEPGGGKTLLARRIAECLRIFCWRTDCSRSDGVFSGTDRRWISAEPCHPLLAIARANHANPMILLDEIDKSGGAGALSVAASGRSEPVASLWHCLLGMLETETSQRYPDPLIQNFVDLSQICYLATANDVTGLPGPLLDRLRIVDMPLPSSHHLDALLPAVLADLARDRGLDARWVLPLDDDERGAIASAWRGGSVRRLRQLVEVIMRDRDANAFRN